MAKTLHVRYKKAAIRVKMDKDTLTNEIKITEGVLQGDLLSDPIYTIYK